MKRRIITFLLSLALVLSSVSGLCAASFTDTESHWAKAYIDRSVELGLFAGVTDEAFAPDQKMTRGMFITVLGRYAGVAADNWVDNSTLQKLFTDVDPTSYYAPYVEWAVRLGIAKGTGAHTFSPDAEITREQMACLLVNYLASTGCALEAPLPSLRKVYAAYKAAQAAPSENAEPMSNLPVEQPTVIAPFNFTDAADIHDWAIDSVELLKYSGLIQGVRQERNTYAFFPTRSATRAECAVVFCRMHEQYAASEQTEQTLPVSIVLNLDSLELMEGCTGSLFAMVFPEQAVNQSLIWYSTDDTVASVDLNGRISANAPGTALIYAMTCNGITAFCQVTCTPYVAPKTLTKDEKEVLVFGTTVSDPRSVYTTAEEALTHMKSITVRTWDVDKDGIKYTRTWSLTIHENIAELVSALFEEIYALPSQPPIHSLGGYRWADINSEHSPGLAIDINPRENYYCRPDGSAIIGMHFKPGVDPYSIPVEGDVDRIFNKYGFTRGIYWSSGYKDYMHYSFFGT